MAAATPGEALSQAQVLAVAGGDHEKVGAHGGGTGEAD
jgi:hypothetical protein